MPHRSFPNESASGQILDIHHSGLKATIPRIKILRAFQTGERRHWTAEEMYHQLLAAGASVGLATVYRVLMQFVEAGLLNRSNFEGGRSVFELNEGHHHDHLVCLSCGRVEEFCDPEIEARQAEVAARLGFELKDHALALYGFCASAACKGGGVKTRRLSPDGTGGAFTGFNGAARANLSK